MRFRRAKKKDIRDDKMFVQAEDSIQEDLLIDELFGNRIPFDDFYNPRDNKITYRISKKVYNYLVNKGIILQAIVVKNIGDLAVEERNRVKQFHKSQRMQRQEKILDELRAEYRQI